MHPAHYYMTPIVILCIVYGTVPKVEPRYEIGTYGTWTS
jgi:hypothetical protein